MENNNEGDFNVGHSNIGGRNVGDRNVGNRNVGDFNVGDRNVGDLNIGDFNVGDLNEGGRNVGHSNIGGRNVGHRNVGNRNVGNWNICDRSVGFCNTIEPKEYLFFNKPCSIPIPDIQFPDFFFFDLTEWIEESNMTEVEKEQNPTYKTTEGYLKLKGNEQAWKESWDKATEDDKRICLSLPNWDNEVFKEISGIDAESEWNAIETEY